MLKIWRAWFPGPPLATPMLHCRPRYLRSTASTAARGKTPTIVTWSEPCYFYAIKTDSRRICSQVRSRAGARVHCKLTSARRSVTREGRGGTIPRASNHYGGVEALWGRQKSQECHKYFIQYSTFASGRPQVRTWGCQVCFLPRALSNLVTPLTA